MKFHKNWHQKVWFLWANTRMKFLSFNCPSTSTKIVFSKNHTNWKTLSISTMNWQSNIIALLTNTASERSLRRLKQKKANLRTLISRKISPVSRNYHIYHQADKLKCLSLSVKSRITLYRTFWNKYHRMQMEASPLAFKISLKSSIIAQNWMTVKINSKLTFKAFKNKH